MLRLEKTAALALVASVLAAGCGDEEPTIALVEPSPGTIWDVGAARDVTWSSSGVDRVRIEFSRNGTWDDVEVIGVADAADSTFAWKATAPVSTQCRIRLRDAFLGTPSSESGVFSIPVELISPADGALWGIGLPATIEWSAVGIAQVDIELSRDGNWLDGDGSDVETAAGPIAAGAGTYTWSPVTGPESDSCLVRVVDSGGSGAGASTWAAIRIWGRTWKVVEGAPAGGDGRFWSTAFDHPQDGVDAAFASADAKAVWVAAGDYYCLGAPAAEVLALADGVAIYGGFAGGETLLGDRNWVTNVATLDGEATYRVVVGAPSARLDGFTVTGGNAGVGGGMYSLSSANLTVANCIFAGNSATHAGGIYCEDSAGVVIADCRFVGNQADIAIGTGGGLRASGCSGFDVRRCVFELNSANLGGASFTSGAYLFLTNCAYWQNTATTLGGAVYILDHDTTIRHCTFNGNQAGDGVATGGGGAIFEFDNILTDEIQVVENSILWGNAAGTDKEIGKGGGMGGLPQPTYTDIEQAGFTGTGNINTDPFFVSSATGDLHLRTSPLSPCIDTGDPAVPVTDDLDGEVRPQGGAPDMGAYEDG